MFFKLLLTFSLILVVNLKYRAVELPDVDLFSLSDQGFDINVCLENDRASTSFMVPPPTCEFSKDDRNVTNVLVTQYQRMVVHESQNGLICKFLEISRYTFENFLKSRSVSELRVWKEPEKQVCLDIMRDKVKMEKVSMIQGAIQYFKVETNYKWMSHVTTVSDIYFVFETKVSFDLNSGKLVKDNKGSPLCSYDSGFCNLGSVGLTFWNISKKIEVEIECPLSPLVTELCAATFTKYAGVKSLQLFCERSGEVFHIHESKLNKVSILCKQVPSMLISNEGAILSLNRSVADSADIGERPTKLEKFIEKYTAHHVICRDQTQESTCRIVDKVLPVDCHDRVSTSESCSPSITAWPNSYCQGLCKLDASLFKCSGTSLVKTWNVTIGHFYEFETQLKQIRQMRSSYFCINVYEKKVEAFNTALFSRKDQGSKIIASFVDEKEMLKVDHVYRGFKRTTQWVCDRRGAIYMSAGSYINAIDKLILKYPTGYHDFSICEKVVQPEEGHGVLISRAIKKSSDPKAFCLRYTGELTTNSVSDSVLDAKLSFIYKKILDRTDAKLKTIRSQVCWSKYQEYISSLNLMSLHPEMFVLLQSMCRKHGRIEKNGLTIVSWPCERTSRFRLLKSGNKTCFSRQKVEFQLQNSKETSIGYLEPILGTVLGNRGHEMKCEDVPEFFSVGHGIILLHNSSGVFMIIEEVRNTVRMQENDIEYEPLDLLDIGNLIEAESLEQRVEGLAREINNNIYFQGVAPGSDSSFDNSIGKRIQKKIYIGSHITQVVVLLGVVILGIITICYCKRICSFVGLVGKKLRSLGDRFARCGIKRSREEGVELEELENLTAKDDTERNNEVQGDEYMERVNSEESRTNQVPAAHVRPCKTVQFSD